jgi:hypothetical protein
MTVRQAMATLVISDVMASPVGRKTTSQGIPPLRDRPQGEIGQRPEEKEGKDCKA